VTALGLLARRRPAFGHLEHLEQCLQARTRLDMRLRRVQLGERGVTYKLDRMASASVPSSALP
jgi:hypothetical protein